MGNSSNSTRQHSSAGLRQLLGRVLALDALGAMVRVYLVKDAWSVSWYLWHGRKNKRSAVTEGAWNLDAES